MIEKLSMEIEGLRELDTLLRALPEKAAGNALATAVSAGARIIRDEVKSRAPVLTGAVQSQVYTKRLRGQSPNEKASIVGVRGGVAKYANTKKNRQLGRAGKAYQNAGKTYYWRFVEFGTSKMAAQPFLRPAFDAREKDAVQAITDKLAERIQKAIEAGK